MLICMFFYDLDKKKHAKIVEELKANSINRQEVLSEEGLDGGQSSEDQLPLNAADDGDSETDSGQKT